MGDEAPPTKDELIEELHAARTELRDLKLAQAATDLGVAPEQLGDPSEWTTDASGQLTHRDRVDPRDGKPLSPLRLVRPEPEAAPQVVIRRTRGGRIVAADQPKYDAARDAILAGRPQIVRFVRDDGPEAA